MKRWITILRKIREKIVVKITRNQREVKLGQTKLIQDDIPVSPVWHYRQMLIRDTLQSFISQLPWLLECAPVIVLRDSMEA